MVDESGFEGAHGLEGLVAGFESKGLLDLVGDELGVLGEVCVALDAGVAGELGDLDAVVNAVAAADNVESAAEDAVLEALGAPLHGFAEVSQLAVDEQGSAPRPAARIAEQVRQLIGLARVPDIDALGHSARLVRAADALAHFLHH